LYFGAEFTKAYALKYGSEIRPDKYAVTVQVVRVESGENSVQENERNAQTMEQDVQRAKEAKKKVG
jgi:membrane protein